MRSPLRAAPQRRERLRDPSADTTAPDGELTRRFGTSWSCRWRTDRTRDDGRCSEFGHDALCGREPSEQPRVLHDSTWRAAPIVAGLAGTRIAPSRAMNSRLHETTASRGTIRGRVTSTLQLVCIVGAMGAALASSACSGSSNAKTPASASDPSPARLEVVDRLDEATALIREFRGKLPESVTKDARCVVVVT